MFVRRNHRMPISTEQAIRTAISSVGHHVETPSPETPIHTTPAQSATAVQGEQTDGEPARHGSATPEASSHAAGWLHSHADENGESPILVARPVGSAECNRVSRRGAGPDTHRERSGLKPRSLHHPGHASPISGNQATDVLARIG